MDFATMRLDQESPGSSPGGATRSAMLRYAVSRFVRIFAPTSEGSPFLLSELKGGDRSGSYTLPEPTKYTTDQTEEIECSTPEQGQTVACLQPIEPRRHQGSRRVAEANAQSPNATVELKVDVIALQPKCPHLTPRVLELDHLSCAELARFPVERFEVESPRRNRGHAASYCAVSVRTLFNVRKGKVACEELRQEHALRRIEERDIKVNLVRPRLQEHRVGSGEVELLDAPT